MIHIVSECSPIGTNGNAYRSNQPCPNFTGLDINAIAFLSGTSPDRVSEYVEFELDQLAKEGGEASSIYITLDAKNTRLNGKPATIKQLKGIYNTHFLHMYLNVCTLEGFEKAKETFIGLYDSAGVPEKYRPNCIRV